ncbi:VOC family protein [Shewanella sp. AS16]|uniref:VOC family protein n=1 Tax=Shewanella sp. AS16 TaxID=2907625 RepID=UPI001F1A1C7D|nr:VOC family protein [Shewanella sp. AS16]MCE9684672.1 VOC family protein [Shewanella sp. AS16]
MPPVLSRVDHIHIYVADLTAAEKWYRDNLGFTRLPALAQWAPGGGPLTLANGSVHLALFDSKTPQNTTVAFGVNCADFLCWQQHLKNCGIHFSRVDHRLAWSIYFADPDGNPFEITSYDYDELAAKLAAAT